MSGATDEEGRRGTFPGGENGGCAAAAGGDPPPSLSSHAASWERSLRMRAVDVRNIAGQILKFESKFNIQRSFRFT